MNYDDTWRLFRIRLSSAFITIFPYVPFAGCKRSQVVVSESWRFMRRRKTSVLCKHMACVDLVFPLRYPHTRYTLQAILFYGPVITMQITKFGSFLYNFRFFYLFGVECARFRYQIDLCVFAASVTFEHHYPWGT